MSIKLPPLPYSYDALEPFISSATLRFHHDYHHKEYVEKTNMLIKGTPYENIDLEEIILASKKKNNPFDSDDLFNNAAQVWNHNFSWPCLTPEVGKSIPAPLLQLIEKKWGCFEKFKSKFIKAGLKQFASGYVWLILTEKCELDIVTTHDAFTPIAEKIRPLITIDLWEHAYYLDVGGNRKAYLQSWFKIANWDFANYNLKKQLSDM